MVGHIDCLNKRERGAGDNDWGPIDGVDLCGNAYGNKSGSGSKMIGSRL